MLVKVNLFERILAYYLKMLYDLQMKEILQINQNCNL
jgi:hypothetical protein